MAAARGDIVNFQIMLEGELEGTRAIALRAGEIKNGAESIASANFRTYAIWYVKEGSAW